MISLKCLYFICPSIFLCLSVFFFLAVFFLFVHMFFSFCMSVSFHFVCLFLFFLSVCFFLSVFLFSFFLFFFFSFFSKFPKIVITRNLWSEVILLLWIELDLEEGPILFIYDKHKFSGTREWHDYFCKYCFRS